MDYKNFFWATKQKVLLTLVLFVLANIFFSPPNPLIDCQLSNPPKCPPVADFLSYEIVYLGFSYLAASIVFHMKKKGVKK